MEKEQSQVSEDSPSPQTVNDEVEKEQSQFSAAAETPHSEDVQPVQNHPQASKVCRVKWKFPNLQTDKQSQASNKYNITFGSNESYEEPTNRPWILLSSSENDLLEKEQSQVSEDSPSPQTGNDEVEKEQPHVSAAAHSEDVQLVQDHPRAYQVRHVKWKFPISETEGIPSNASAADEDYGSEKWQDAYQDSGTQPSHQPQHKNDRINYLYHWLDILRTKLLKKNFFLTREKDRVAAEITCFMTEEKLFDVRALPPSKVWAGAQAMQWSNCRIVWNIETTSSRNWISVSSERGRELKRAT